MKKQSGFKKFLLVSLLIHLVFFIFSVAKVVFLPTETITIEPTMRVDIVALPDKIDKIPEPIKPIEEKPKPVEKPKPKPKPEKKAPPKKIEKTPEPKKTPEKKSGVIVAIGCYAFSFLITLSAEPSLYQSICASL